METDAKPQPPATTPPAASKVQVFSDVEKALLVKLREALPDIVKTAGETSTAPVSATLWGVPLLQADTDKQESDPRIDVILVKFLRARNNDIDQAREMLASTLKWRAEFGIDGLLDETFPAETFGSVGYIHGTDKDGRPVTYNFYGSLDNKAVFGDLDRFLRWRVQLHERGMRMVDFVNTADMVQVHDYEGVSLFSYDKLARAASRATVQLMSDNYPETLATKIFANVPAWGETIFNIIGRWLSDETKKKFVVVGAANAYAALADRIDPENIPDKFVGKSESTPSAAVERQEPGSKAAATAAATTSDDVTPPEPQPAHVDAADDLPAPTDTGTGEGVKGGDDAVDSAKPQPAQVTAAPEESGDNANGADIDDEPTAGMRLDSSKTAENDATEEETKLKDGSADQKPTATTTNDMA
ncbi:Non-classical phosphatidylinositol transfer protein (PITP) [Coemansia sp. RSA 1646]|nr:Non-classical phosphatidylinositol transfer protein (PITP) [Coemansia sp. RSA 1646]KAJ2085779.1 Non-classical phosphatidylinositol transfer protein (PITP) [Coemansia sp. RSA 986]